MYTNRTSEGFETITGINNADKYSNLYYSIGRNLRDWFPYMATAAKYLKDSNIVCTEFKINDALETKLLTETFTVKDKEPIKEADIRELKKLNPIIHEVTVVADWYLVLQLIDDIQLKKGFIRVQTFDGKIIKGYPKKISYIWSTNELKLELQEKYESDYLKLYKDGGIIYINEVGYPLKQGLFSYEMNYDYIKFRDGKRVLIINPFYFKNIELEGVVYDDKVEFMNALNEFIDE